MAGRGFALYKKEKKLYILDVAYEYNDTKFIGFVNTGDAFEVNKLNEKQRNWIKTHDISQDENLKKFVFIGDYFIKKVPLAPFPTGSPYTQLPGGGGVYKETRKYTNIRDLFKNPTFLRAVGNYGVFSEEYIAIKKVIKEAIDHLVNSQNIEKNKLIGLKKLEDEAKKFNTSEELLRSGGFSIDALDMAAFGFTEDSVKQLMPNQLSIKWKDDLDGVKWEQEKSRLSKIEWAKKINLSEPIDVSFNGKKFYIEDGHHRYYAAKILGKPLNVELEIKANPIAPLSNKDYDDFHREFFDKFNHSKISEVVLKKKDIVVSFTAVSIEDESEKDKLNSIFDSISKNGSIPEGFVRPQFKDGTLDYHMTIIGGPLPPKFFSDLNKEVVLNINTLGISDKAIALGVSGDYFSSNESQHITLAFKGFPKYSKEIENWEPLKKSFKVKGVIREFDIDKNILKRGIFKTPVDEANQIQIGNFPDQTSPAGNGSSFPKENV